MKHYDGDLQFYMLMLDDAERRLRAARRAVHKTKDEVRFYQRKITEVAVYAPGKPVSP